MFYSSKEYTRKVTCEIVSSVGQFAHVPLVDIERALDDKSLKLFRCIPVKNETKIKIGVIRLYKIDQILSILKKKYGSLCPVCLTPVFENDELHNGYVHKLMPTFVEFQGYLNWNLKTEVGMNKGTMHRQCKPTYMLLNELEEKSRFGSEFSDHDIHQIASFIARKGIGKVFSDFVESRPRVELRFNPRVSMQRDFYKIPAFDGFVDDCEIEELAA